MSRKIPKSFRWCRGLYHPVDMGILIGHYKGPFKPTSIVACQTSVFNFLLLKWKDPSIEILEVSDGQKLAKLMAKKRGESFLRFFCGPRWMVGCLRHWESSGHSPGSFFLFWKGWEMTFKKSSVHKKEV